MHCGVRAKGQAGVVLLAVLVFLLVTTLAASGLVVNYTTDRQREKEKELLFAGDQIRSAIISYYSTVPVGGVRTLPHSLEELVDDHRFATPRHHLRRVFSDPMSGKPDWGLVQRGDGIVGVHSRSKARPVRRSEFAVMYASFAGAEHLSDWVFQLP